MHIIHVATDFSSVPAGRFRMDGPFSGEQFREEHLRPLLARGEKVIVDLDNVEGYGSSFLEEAFGGLVRYGYFTRSQLRNMLELRCDDQTYIDEIWSYINEAIPAPTH